MHHACRRRRGIKQINANGFGKGRCLGNDEHIVCDMNTRHVRSTTTARLYEITRPGNYPMDLEPSRIRLGCSKSTGNNTENDKYNGERGGRSPQLK